MKRVVFLIVLLVLVGCSTVTTKSVVPSVPVVTSAPAVSTVSTPAKAPVIPPSGGTISSEPINDTHSCVVSGDCVLYEEKDGAPGELCERYDDVGCYHSYACNSMGEVVQKETPAFCGR